jgi:uncharacterized protein (DUF433 family)
VLERLGEGAISEDLVANYVGLSTAHIQAANAFAVAMLRRDELVWSA